jgi:hypothetical protein
MFTLLHPAKLELALQDFITFCHIELSEAQQHALNRTNSRVGTVHKRLEHFLWCKSRVLECLFDLETWLEMYNRSEKSNAE